MVVKAGYLLRGAQIQGETLLLSGDVNVTTSLEVVGSNSTVKSLSFNGQDIQSDQQSATGSISATVNFAPPPINLPTLSTLEWKVLDSLPEIQQTYDDSAWTPATLTYTNDSFVRALTTPNSLYLGDYGYNTGYSLSRGHFIASGQETVLSVLTQGGTAYGASVWLNNTFLGSWSGNSVTSNYTQNITLPSKLTANQPHVITVLMDDMGNDENGVITADNVSIFPPSF